MDLKKLAITHSEAEDAIERLIRVGLLEENEGHLQSQKDFYFVPSGVPSESIKNFHLQLIKKAELSILNESLDTRYAGSSMLYMKKSRLPELKTRLQNFRRELCAWLETEPEPDSVYSISFQAIRLDHDV